MKLFITFRTVFYSVVNAFNAFERKHDEIVGKFKSGGEETKLYDYIVRIIVLLERWLLQIEPGSCMGTKDKKHHGIKRFGNKASCPFEFMGNCFVHLQQFNINLRESCLAGKYLQSIGLDSVEQQWRSLLKQKSFKQAANLLNNLEYL